MKKILKVGVLLIVVLALALVALRITGLDPQELEGQELKAAHDITRPGLWLRGEVVTTPVSDWSFVDALPKFGPNKNIRVMIETRTPYFVPHSVTTAFWIGNGQMYVPSHQGCSPGLDWDACLKVNQEYNSINETFPKNKFWTANVFRDPRVRMKIGGKIYEMTMLLITNKQEAAMVLGRDPEVRTKGPDGQEHITGYTHVFHVYQRNITEWGAVDPASLLNLSKH